MTDRHSSPTLLMMLKMRGSFPNFSLASSCP